MGPKCLGDELLGRAERGVDAGMGESYTKSIYFRKLEMSELNNAKLYMAIMMYKHRYIFIINIRAIFVLLCSATPELYPLPPHFGQKSCSYKPPAAITTSPRPVPEILGVLEFHQNGQRFGRKTPETTIGQIQIQKTQKNWTNLIKMANKWKWYY